MFNLSDISSDWTLFLDRDGVINIEKEDDYIRSKDEFVFYDDALAALKILSDIFDTIIIVTNQRGIGRGLMTEAHLTAIHDYMLHAIKGVKGRIDKIYFCSDVDSTSPNRKPNAGMAFRAQQDFPRIRFEKSLIAGNKLSDMQFGRNAGMHTVYIATTHPEVPFPHPLIDARFCSLMDFAQHLNAEIKKS